MKYNFRTYSVLILLACFINACLTVGNQDASQVKESGTHSALAGTSTNIISALITVNPTATVTVSPTATITVSPTATRIPTLTRIPTITPVPIGTQVPLAPLEPPKRILFIGNSLSYWNGGVDYHLKELAKSAEPALAIETDNSYIPGGTLEDHWLSSVHTKIAEGDFDIVILQEESNRAFVSDVFRSYTRRWVAEVRGVGSVPVLYMPNPFSGGGSIDQVIRVHNEIATELGLHVAPVALAWIRITNERPDFNLYDEDDPYVKILGGEAHPNIQGTYLGACILYATLYGVSPEGLSYLPEGITEDEADFLQRIAWETVQEYLAERTK